MQVPLQHAPLQKPVLPTGPAAEDIVKSTQMVEGSSYTPQSLRCDTCACLSFELDELLHSHSACRVTTLVVHLHLQVLLTSWGCRRTLYPRSQGARHESGRAILRSS